MPTISVGKRGGRGGKGRKITIVLPRVKLRKKEKTGPFAPFSPAYQKGKKKTGSHWHPSALKRATERTDRHIPSAYCREAGERREKEGGERFDQHLLRWNRRRTAFRLLSSPHRDDRKEGGGEKQKSPYPTFPTLVSMREKENVTSSLKKGREKGKRRRFSCRPRLRARGGRREARFSTPSH